MSVHVWNFNCTSIAFFLTAIFDLRFVSSLSHQATLGFKERPVGHAV